MAGEFEGKVVMVTGANGNLGRGVVRRFSEAGAKMVLVERHKDLAKSCASDLGLAEDQCLTVEADVTAPASVQAAIDVAVADFGQINALVHTVGGYGGGKAVHDLDFDLWDKMMTLNARSFFVTGGSVANYMRQTGIQGSIVVVLARHALEGQKNHSAYGASKAAVQRIMQSMAKELLDQGIRVNGVVPGTIDTPQNRSDMPNADFDKWVQPESIADVVVFLSSARAGSVSGDSVTVYGRS